MIPKTFEVSKVHNDEQQKNIAMQHEQEAASQHKAEDGVKIVHSKENAQKAKVSNNQKKNQEQEQKKKRKKNKGNYGKDSELKQDEQTSTIDIRL
jgi:hypothetical protein